jgi:hypothetical protein
MIVKYKCPCCGKTELDDDENYICSKCGWNDLMQDRGDEDGGINYISLNQAKARVAQGKNVVDGGALPWQPDYAGNSPSSPPRNVANTARRP